jgi:hypothetical protein
MNQSNPVLESQASANANKHSKTIKYPVKIYCIVDDLSEASRDSRIREIRTHAINSGAIFTTREYDSRKFSNDRDVIERLPAFHAYINKAYNRTFYTNTRPLDHINECIDIYTDDQEKKIKRKEKWLKMYKSFKDLIHKLSRRETAMERYEKEQFVDIVDTSHHGQIKKNTVPISEWN